MATEEIAFKINTDSSQTEKSVKSIKRELREATQEALMLSRTFGDTSDEALAAQQRVADLRDEIGDFSSRVDALNPDAKFTAFSQSLQGVVGGFAGLQGAIGLFGTESAELEKQLLKVQSALALSEGLNSILESADAFKSLGVVGVQAFNSIKAAIGATGIGLLVIALGAIYANWDKIKTLVGGVSDEQEKLNESANENLKTQQEKLSAIDGQSNQLKLQGKSEKEILQIKSLQTTEAIKAAEISIENAKITKNAQVEASQRNFKILKGLVNLVSLPITALLGGIDLAGKALGKNFGLIDKYTSGVSKLIFDPEATAKAGDDTIKEAENTLNELKEKQAGYAIAIKDIDKKNADEQKANREKAETDRLAKEKADLEKQGAERIAAYEKEQKEIKDKEEKIKSLKVELQKDNEQFLKDSANKKIAIELDTASKQISANAKVYAAYEENAKHDLLVKETAAKAEIELLNAVSSTAGQLSEIAGKETAAGKALAVAQALINTYQGITAGVKLGFPAAIPAILAASVTGFKAVKSIIAVKVPGGGGGGSSAPGGFSSPSLAQAAQAPIQSGISVQQTQAIGTANVNVQNQQTIKAFVVERDITDSQDRINKIKQAATI